MYLSEECSGSLLYEEVEYSSTELHYYETRVVIYRHGSEGVLIDTPQGRHQSVYLLSKNITPEPL